MTGGRTVEKLLLALSGLCCTLLLMQTPSPWSFAVTALLSLGILLGLMLRTGLARVLLKPMHPGFSMAAAVLSLSEAYLAKSAFYTTCHGWIAKVLALLGLPGQGLILRGIPWLVGLGALPMLFLAFRWFLGVMGDLGLRFWRKSDFTERLFLLGAGLLLSMVIVFSYQCSQAFYGAHINGHWYNFDLIYSSDSGYLVRQDVFRNVGAEQNDVRQPLYGVFAMPFAHGIWLLSWLVGKLIPAFPEPYITLWQMAQMLLLLVGMVLLSRMMDLRGAEKALFLGLMTVSYPTLIFSLMAEQYLMAVFYLLLLIYLAGERVHGPLCFLGATGSLLTSGIWFPLVTWEKDRRAFVRNTLRLFLVFCAATVLSGRLTAFLDLPRYIEGFRPYAGGQVAAAEKLRQFVNFAGACLAAPASGVDFETLGHASWQLLPVTGWSPAGVAVLVLAIGGVVFGEKDRLTWISALWMGFSFLLLGIVGWGTIDNGLMLYSLYFGWAYTAMIYRLISRVLRRWRPLKLAVLLILAVALAIINVFGLREVLVFGTQFYPALGGIA